MKKKLLAMLLVAGGSAFAQGQFSAGVSVGGLGYYPPAGAYGAPPPCGPGYVWIDGYNEANGYWVDGYCAVPPYSGAYWIAPGYFGGRFVAGYWGRGDSFRGGYGTASRFQSGYTNGFRSSGAAPSFRSQGGGYNNSRPQAGASNSFHSQGSYPGGGSAMRGSGSGTRGGGSEMRGSGHGGRR